MTKPANQSERLLAAILIVVGVAGCVASSLQCEVETAVVFGALASAGLTKLPRPNSRTRVVGDAIAVVIALLAVAYVFGDSLEESLALPAAGEALQLMGYFPAPPAANVASVAFSIAARTGSLAAVRVFA